MNGWWNNGMEVYGIIVDNKSFTRLHWKYIFNFELMIVKYSVIIMIGLKFIK